MSGACSITGERWLGSKQLFERSLNVKFAEFECHAFEDAFGVQNLLIVFTINICTLYYAIFHLGPTVFC